MGGPEVMLTEILQLKRVGEEQKPKGQKLTCQPDGELSKTPRRPHYPSPLYPLQEPIQGDLKTKISRLARLANCSVTRHNLKSGWLVMVGFKLTSVAPIAFPLILGLRGLGHRPGAFWLWQVSFAVNDYRTWGREFDQEEKRRRLFDGMRL
jgi:hypothetical protein